MFQAVHLMENQIKVIIARKYNLLQFSLYKFMTVTALLIGNVAKLN